MINFNYIFALWIRIIIISLTSIILYSIYATIFSSPPVVVSDSIVNIRINKKHKSITEIRKLIGTSDIFVKIAHTYYQEDDPTNFFAIEGGSIHAHKGSFISLYITDLPSWVYGRWCSKLNIIYQQPLSLREHNYEAKDVCFETTEYE